MKHIAVDLGAESGRVFVGDLNHCELVYRFPNQGLWQNNEFHWDIKHIFQEILVGLEKAFSIYKKQIFSIGIDTWGVDYALLDDKDELIGLPFHYRDNRSDGIMEEVFSIMPQDFIYRRTGIQFMPFNSLFQLYAHKKHSPHDLNRAQSFLTIPDLLHFWLCGVKANEYSNASTTQLLNAKNKTWENEIIEAIGLPRKIFQEIVMPGTQLGELLPSIARKINAPDNIKIITPACHDTASAVAAVPLTHSRENFAYLSSGTWSLMGYEIDAPLINQEVLENNFTNEGGTEGKIRFLKNIMGLWVLQQCKKEWNQSNPELSYDDIENLARSEKDYNFTIDIDNNAFLKPGTKENPMTLRITEFCRSNKSREPENIGQFAKLIFMSLAQRYKEIIDTGDSLIGRKSEKLYIFGGGSRQDFLCRLTANKTGIPLSAGPVEASAWGNILIQAKTCGSIQSLGQGRRMIQRYSNLREYFPE